MFKTVVEYAHCDGFYFVLTKDQTVADFYHQFFVTCISIIFIKIRHESVDFCDLEITDKILAVSIIKIDMQRLLTHPALTEIRMRCDTVTANFSVAKRRYCTCLTAR